MVTESARMNSAAEARFRVQAPNSRPRSVKVFALDTAAESVVRRLAGDGWHHAAFFLAVSADDAMTDLSGARRAVAHEVETADLVVLVAGPGGHAPAAPIVGRACSLRRVMTTGCVVGTAAASEQELSKTLAQ